jgi:hypothetical protein
LIGVVKNHLFSPSPTNCVHLTSSPGARPSGRFTARMEVKETIDLRAGDVEAA